MHSEAVKSTDQMMDRNSENSRSKHAQPEGIPTNPSTKKFNDQHHPCSTAVDQVVSVKDSPNYSYKLRVADERDITEESINPSKPHSRKATPAPAEFKSSPMRRFKAFSSPKIKIPRHTPLGTDGPAASIKRDSVLKRVFKSDNLTLTASHTSDNDMESPFKTRQSKQAPVVTVSGSPRVSVKDLAARFNTAASKSLYVPSPRSSPVKNSFDDFRVLSEPPKDGVISPYTSNPPSPTKSQRSGKSDRSIRGRLSLQDPQFTVPTRLSTPRRMVRTSTPLPSVGKPVEETIPPIPDKPNGQQMDKPYLRKYSSLNFSMPRALQAPERDAALPDSSKDLRTFDGYESVTKFHTTLPGFGTPPPTSSNIHFANPRPIALGNPPISHPRSQISVISSTEGRRIPVPSPVPSRSNSILHGQVCALQRQLDEKMEQIKQLKQQLENKGILDIGSLSEQLREAKREILSWKSRAEVAEKQIEVMGKLSIKSRPSTSRVKPDPADKRTATNNREGVVLARKIQNALRMMDGASSQQRNSSLESSDTILHDLTATESEFGVWAEQISMGINSNSLLQVSSHSPKLLLDFRGSEEI
jgi:hypothetical protein